MKWVCFLLSVGKIRLFFRKYKEIFKYFQIFRYKNTRILGYFRIHSAINAQNTTDIYRYLHILADICIRINTLLYLYTPIREDLHIRIPAYSHIQIRTFFYIRIFGYVDI